MQRFTPFVAAALICSTHVGAWSWCGGVVRAARRRLRHLIRKNTLSKEEARARGRFPTKLVKISTQEGLKQLEITRTINLSP